jgi:hypothetical protein
MYRSAAAALPFFRATLLSEMATGLSLYLHIWRKDWPRTHVEGYLRTIRGEHAMPASCYRDPQAFLQKHKSTHFIIHELSTIYWLS